MDGVTTAIVLFIFACVAFPALVKNRPQFYAAFVCVLLIILLHALRLMVYNSPGFQVASGALTGLLQLVAIVMLFLCAGGLTFKEFTGDMARAFEVIRRGEEEKQIIIPLTGQVAPREPARQATGRGRGEEEQRQVETIDLPEGAGWPGRPPAASAPEPPQPPPGEQDKGSIPLE